MPVVEFCRSDVLVVDRNSTVIEAARRMREAHLGDVVICSEDNGISKPIGILTDRDIVIGVLALDLPLDAVRVEDVMTPALVTIRQNVGVYEAIQLMETYGVRRLPMVNDEGALIGITSAADLMELLGREIMALSRLPSQQRQKEQEIRQ